MKTKSIFKLGLIFVSLFVVFIQTYCKAQSNSSNQKNKQQVMKYTTEEKKAMQIADSVAKSELKKYSDSHLNMISDGQLSLKYYDKTIESLDKNINAYEITYTFNQDIGGKVLFPHFSIVVNIDTKETKFINEGQQTEN